MSNKEPKALTKDGKTVKETNPIPIPDTTGSTVEKNKASGGTKKGADEKSTSADATFSPEKQTISAAPSRAAAVANKNSKSHSSPASIVIRLLVAAAVIAILAFSAYQFYITSYANSSATKLAELQRAVEQAGEKEIAAENTYTNDEMSAFASQANSGLPKMVDKDTRLDSTIGIAGAFQYNYTLVNVNSEINSWDSLKIVLEKSLVRWVCTTEYMFETFIRKEVTVSFAYFASDRRLLGVISVEPSRCASGS